MAGKLLKNINQGFTIIELMIVISVISILAGISIVSYNGMQKGTRDKEREADVEAIQAELESYYNQEGGYPHTRDINSALLSGKPPLGLTEAAITSPTGNAPAIFGGTKFSLRGDKYHNRPSNINEYTYRGYDKTGYNICPDSENTCSKYEIRWRSEKDNKEHIVTSLYGW